MNPLRLKLHSKLKKNITFFGDISKEKLKQEVLPFHELVANWPLFENKNRLIEILNQTTATQDNIRFMKDKLLFVVKGLKEVSNNEYPQLYNTFFKETTIPHQQKYWEVIDNENRFKKIPLFSCFEDVVISTDKLRKFMGAKSLLYNTKKWLAYMKYLTEISFPEFIFNKQLSSQILRFEKKINEFYSLVIEYDEKELEAQINKGGYMRTPEYRILVINNNFPRQYKKDDYLNNQLSYSIYLGNMFHPVFVSGIVNLGSYAAKLDHKKNDDGSYSTVYYAKCKNLSENQVQIYHDEDTQQYGDKLVKYAFYAMNMEAVSSNIYLQYIEKALTEALCDSE